MKKIPLILIILTFFGCNQKEKNLNLAKTETKTQLTKKSETIFWIDTISNGKFLKIYSKPENDWQNLTAEYGNENKKHKIDLRTEEYQMLGIPFTNQIEWITEKSFALINGCGTNCRYVLIFNTESEKPIVMPIEYYPEIKHADYKTENRNLYISVEQNNDNSLNLIIIETDSQKKDKVNLPKDWNRGIGQIYDIIDKIEIKNSNDIKFTPQNNVHYDSIDGGEYFIFKLNVQISEKIIKDKAATIDVVCEYKTRNHEEPVIVNEQLSLRLYSEDEFETIENPYAPIADGGPVTDKRMFYGRDEFINNRITAILNADSKQIIIYGQKRSGKSSVLHHLKQGLEATDRTFCISFSLGEIIRDLNEYTFYYKVIYGISRNLRLRAPGA